ncbi:MAG TPA: hypothetical protein VMY77_01930 [Chitinophagaceae bacterium]|nr:hypothetical protein [Chitinophagaceae bacterium]
MSSHQIDILPSYQIDKQKWDDCIYKSGNSLIYVQSYYLDALSDNWHGIIVNDYDCIMPIPWRKKLGIRYCYDVPFIQQLGYFNTNDDIKYTPLMDAFSSFIKYGHYNFNYNNHAISDRADVITATNFIIELTDKETVTNNFTKSCKQSLQNSAKHDMTYVSASPAEPIEMHRGLYKSKLKMFRQDDYSNFTRLAEKLNETGNCLARKIINKEGHTLSIVLLLKDERRLYNMINVTNEEGRKKEANYFLYAKVFDEFAGKGLLFDLEGSELAGVKSFYKKFGATDQPYYRMHINHLPIPIKHFAP